MAELRRFFTERHNLRVGSSVKLPDDEARHIRHALRLGPDDHIKLFNGEKEYIARLKVVTNEAVMAEVIEQVAMVESIGPQITLFQGIIRLPQMETVLQKTTELGVNNVVPLETEFSQVQINNPEKRFERWEKIIKEACKQSERTQLPNLFQPLKFADLFEFAQDLQIDLLLLLTTPRDLLNKISPLQHLSELQQKVNKAKHVGLLIGPEGGFSPFEHKIAAEHKAPFVVFNQHILRSETAGIAAVGITKFIAESKY